MRRRLYHIRSDIDAINIHPGETPLLAETTLMQKQFSDIKFLQTRQSLHGFVKYREDRLLFLSNV
jgi:hypothetical protein